MTDPFATALAALHASPLAVAAVYQSAELADLPIRVIRSQATEDLPIGGSSYPVGTDIVSIQRADVPAPASGDMLQIGDDLFRIMGEPRLDAEALSWSCEIEGI